MARDDSSGKCTALLYRNIVYFTHTSKIKKFYKQFLFGVLNADFYQKNN
jgi:hypothetical protein